MSEYVELTSDEIRLLREHRAKAAMAERPPPLPAVILRQMVIIRQAAATMLDVERNHPLAVKILELVPAVVAPS